MPTLKTQALPRGSVHPPAPRLRHALLAPLVEHWRAYLAMNAGFYGLVFLGMLAAWRILRCNPLCHGGHDPVPARRTRHCQEH